MSSLGDAYRAAHAQDSSLGYGRFPVAQVFAPGRTELAGNHVDHQNGVVLTGTLELGIRGQAAENGTDTVHIESSGYPAFEILLDDVRTGRIELDWTPGTPIDVNQSRALAIGVLAGFVHAGFDMRGFDLQLEADLPSGSGLSSSAAFELAIASVCNLFFSGNRIPPEKLALLAQSAERDYLGKPCGLMDQMAIACGGLVAMDFANPTNPQVKSIAAKFASFGYDLCLVNMGADHSAFVEEYAQVPADMHNVASFLGGTTLRDVPRATLYDHLDDVRFALGDGALLRAMHYYRECDLTRKRIRALEQGDFDAFLRCTALSSASSAQYLQNVSVPGANQPAMVALAFADQVLDDLAWADVDRPRSFSSLASALGSRNSSASQPEIRRGVCRIHGGGFGGSIQVFVPREQTAQFAAIMDGHFGAGACLVARITTEGSHAWWK